MGFDASLAFANTKSVETSNAGERTQARIAERKISSANCHGGASTLK